MAEYIRMPQKGLTEESALLAEWYVKKGDTVNVGQPLFALETGKAAFDVESEVSGTVLDMFAKEGDEIPIKAIVLVVGEPGEVYDPETVKASGISSDRIVTEEEPAPVSATTDTASSTDRYPGGGEEPDLTPAPTSAPSASGKRGIKISPRARKLAQTHGISVEGIKGTGPGGRIIVDDIKAAIESGVATAGAGAAQAEQQRVAFGAAASDAARSGGTTGALSPADEARTAGARTPAGARSPSEEKPTPTTGPYTDSIPVSKMRSIIAKRLSDSFFTAPHTFLRIVLSLDNLFETRARIHAEGGKTLSLNAFFIKVAAETLKRHPIINATWKESSIELFQSIDIGLAVALPEGLITPIVRDCGNKGVEQINTELVDLIEKAKTGKLAPEQYNGATFTISNLGSYGLEEFTAIINPPGSAILALGEAVKEPVVMEDDEVEIRRRMRATLSCDHRVIDGAAGAAFLRDLKRVIEEPLRIILT